MPRKGTVLLVNPAGLGMVRDERTRDVFGFTFGQILGYRGETARELGLRAGRRVDFEASDDRVHSLTLSYR